MSAILPVIILAGGDYRRKTVPAGKRAGDMLEGYKGALPLPNGKPLVGELIDRFRESGRFERPLLIGPTNVYGALSLDCEIINSQGNFYTTLAKTIDIIHQRFGALVPIAITACDILPRPDELVSLLTHDFDQLEDCVFWGQFTAAQPQQMGASGWKPAYRMLDQSRKPLNLYPGHLVIIRPGALRLEITMRLLHLAYRYRNRPLWQRAVSMNLRGLWFLVWQDLRNLLRLQLPMLTLVIPYHCLYAYFRYRRGRLSVTGFERAFARIFIHRRFQHSRGGRPVVFAVTPIRSLAKDFDTKAELAEAMQA